MNLKAYPNQVRQFVGRKLKQFFTQAKPEDAEALIEDAEGHWITLKSSEEKGGGARRVLIGKGGKVLGGDLPKEEQGKQLGEAMEELSDKNKGEEPPPESKELTQLERKIKRLDEFDSYLEQNPYGDNNASDWYTEFLNKAERTKKDPGSKEIFGKTFNEFARNIYQEDPEAQAKFKALQAEWDNQAKQKEERKRQESEQIAKALEESNRKKNLEKNSPEWQVAREQVFAEWREAVNKELNIPPGDWVQANKAHQISMQAKYRAVPFMTDKEYTEERQQTVFQLMVGRDPKHRDRVLNGSFHIPLDLLDKLAAKGFRVEIVRGKGRANYSPSQSKVTVYSGDSPTVVAHEMAHALDHLFAQGGVQKQGFGWGVSYSGQTDKDFLPGFGSELKDKAEVLKGEYTGIVKENGFKRGVYTNGDGEYHKDNWVNVYEGRIYPGYGPGVEWWSMNMQYYYEYLTKFSGYASRLSYLKKESEGVSSGTGIAGYSEGYKARRKQEYEKLAGESPEEYAKRNAGNWSKAKKRYPKMAEFLEQNFGPDKRTLGQW
jgi:hypothetical protein